MSEAGDTGAGAAENGNGAATGGTSEGASDFIDLNGLEIPPELHGHMRSYIKSKVDPAVTQKMQELASLRKPFEHLQGIDGLSDMDPDDLRALLDFHGTASDPAQFSEWFTNVAKQSLQENPDGFEEWWKSIGLEMGYDFDGDDTGEESDEAATAGMTREDLEAFYAEKEKEREAKETQAREQDQATQAPNTSRAPRAGRHQLNRPTT
jgi:hypothetical protein